MNSIRLGTFRLDRDKRYSFPSGSLQYVKVMKMRTAFWGYS
jgi:hypothetical protein